MGAPKHTMDPLTTFAPCTTPTSTAEPANLVKRSGPLVAPLYHGRLLVPPTGVSSISGRQIAVVGMTFLKNSAHQWRPLLGPLSASHYGFHVLYDESHAGSPKHKSQESHASLG